MMHAPGNRPAALRTNRRSLEGPNKQSLNLLWEVRTQCERTVIV
jgi:hypothetical protein